jgi:DNA-binding winged helix-turn-helix (wHTH) protein/tetratricopeptide (TPR) repeat protein
MGRNKREEFVARHRVAPNYRFGSFLFDVAEHRLIRAGRSLPVKGKPLQVLLLLVEAGGRLVTRETFMVRLWPDVTVEERNLTVHVSTLRKVLDDSPSQPSCIETVARTGYRLRLPVHRLTAGEAAMERPAGEARAEPFDWLAWVDEEKDLPATGAAMPPNHGARQAKACLLQLQARRRLHLAERVPTLEALALFEKALELDPNQAEAHAGLALTYMLLASTRIRHLLPVDVATTLARESAERALALDENLGEARTALGRLEMVYAWDWSGAATSFARGAALSPGSVESAEAHGWFLASMGQHKKAVEELERAHRLDPSHRDALERLGLVQWMAGKGERALATLARVRVIHPESRRPHLYRMLMLDDLGRHDEAMAERVAWLRLDDPGLAARLARLHRDGAWRTAMSEWIAEVESRTWWFEAAVQAMAIDETARSLANLERMVAARGDGVPILRAVPAFHAARGTPRFEDLLLSVGLDDASVAAIGAAAPHYAAP